MNRTPTIITKGFVGLVAGVFPFVAGLRCESRVNPAGIDSLQPRLSWQLESDRRGGGQTAYQILVTTSANLLRAGTADPM